MKITIDPAWEYHSNELGFTYTWPVYDKYYIFPGKNYIKILNEDGTTKGYQIKNINSSEIITDPEDINEVVGYKNNLDEQFKYSAGDDDLFDSFIRIINMKNAKINEKNLLSFYHSYGHLGYEYLGNGIISDRDKALPDTQINGIRAMKGEPIYWIKEHVKNINICLEIKYWIDILANDITAENRVNYIKLKYCSKNVDQKFMIGQFMDTVLFENSRSIDNITLLRRLMTGIINENMKNIRRMVNYEDNKFISSFSFRALLDVVYWILADKISGPIKLCKTEGCGNYFPSRGKKEHCTDSCASKARVQNFRNKQKSNQ